VNTTFVNDVPFTPKSVASILEIDLDTTIQYGIALAEPETDLPVTGCVLTKRVGDLPQLLRDLIHRLRHPAISAFRLRRISMVNYGDSKATLPPVLVEE
jgi:hypothetical protein